jgi:hypothetical protein
MKCKLQNSTQANSDALLLRIAHYSLFLAWVDTTQRFAY